LHIYKVLISSLSFLILLFFIQCGADYKPKTADTGSDNEIDLSAWIDVKEGNMPLIISAPHGGTLTPGAIPDRTCPNITTVRDRNTTELAFKMGEQLYEKYGVRPYIVSALITRRKIDLNRDLHPATCGDSTAMDLWHEYHDQIEAAIAEAVNEFGKAIFIDVHGHGHSVQRLELGYLLSRSDLRNSYEDKSVAEELGSKSSFRNLLNSRDDVSFYDLMFAEDAFGTLMERSDFPSVPSLYDPFPYPDEAYFTGGYNTRRYTSEDYPNIFGMQIEANFSGVRDSDIHRMEFSKAFADAIMNMIHQYITEEI
jgi:N-formylglutamate amidohydrolase